MLVFAGLRVPSRLLATIATAEFLTYYEIVHIVSCIIQLDSVD